MMLAFSPMPTPLAVWSYDSMSNVHAQRKLDHLRICATRDVRARGVSTGLRRFRLEHCALPELDLHSVDLATSFLDHRLRAPLLISALTGGTQRARSVNRNLAAAAQAHGIAMCVGSQRAGLESSGQARTYQVRDVAPDILLLANVGAVQLNYGYGLDHCRRAVEMIGADALVLHLNPLQEAIQPDGNTDFSGLLKRIEGICQALAVPVLVKEVGWGLSGTVAVRLAQAGVCALDVAGAGGTSWSEVERYRARTDLQRQVAEDLAGWGIPTADCIIQVRRALPRIPLIASGGIETGPDTAVAIALGADLVGMARNLLSPALESAQSVSEVLTRWSESLRITMFAAGTASIAALKKTGVVANGQVSGGPE
jgi:isopentenyl-diphosphate Delta-isomerase